MTGSLRDFTASRSDTSVVKLLGTDSFNSLVKE